MRLFDSKQRKAKIVCTIGPYARLLSKIKPGVPIITFTPDEKIRNRACLYYGITSKIMNNFNNL